MNTIQCRKKKHRKLKSINIENTLQTDNRRITNSDVEQRKKWRAEYMHYKTPSKWMTLFSFDQYTNENMNMNMNTNTKILTCMWDVNDETLNFVSEIRSPRNIHLTPEAAEAAFEINDIFRFFFRAHWKCKFNDFSKIKFRMNRNMIIIIIFADVFIRNAIRWFDNVYIQTGHIQFGLFAIKFNFIFMYRELEWLDDCEMETK